MKISNNNVNNEYSEIRQLSTGKRINGAADDAAGLAIANKMESEARELNAETNNASDTKNMHQTAEGGLKGVYDSLSRMKELALQASNSFLTGNDKKAIQKEIDGLKQGIEDMLGGTEFNTKNILNEDGSAILDTLGIADFDVTKSFDMSKLDYAMDTVSSQMSERGAVMNRLDYTITSNEIAEINQLNSKSRIEDLDFGSAVTEKKRDELLNKVGLHMKKDSMQKDGMLVNMLF